MGLSYRQRSLRSVTVAALLVLSVQPSHLKTISRGAKQHVRSDFHHNSENIPAHSGRSWGGASLESEPFLDSHGGNLDIGESAPQNEARRISTLLSRNIPRVLRGSQTLRQPNRFSAWSHLSKPDFERPAETLQQLNTPQLSLAISELQNGPPETSDQGVNQNRDRDNDTLEERLEAGLQRVERNIEGFVVGFLQLQRSVFNLEQLQELLVLLLEDILKQTGIIDSSPSAGRGFVKDESESESEEDQHSSNRKSDADMLSRQKTGSLEDHHGENRNNSSGSDERGHDQKEGKIKTESFGKGHLGKNSTRTGQRNNIQDIDLFSGTEDFGRSLHETKDGIKTEGSSPQIEKVKPNEDNSEDNDQKNEGSDSRDSDEDYDTSEDYDGDSDDYATDPTEPPTETVTASTATDIESQRWSERLVGMSSADMLQDRLRARFDNLVQQVAARLSSSLLTAQSNQETGWQPRPSFGDTSTAFGKDLSRFHLFDPSMTSAEDLSGFSSSELNNVQRQRITRPGATLTHHSPRNHLAPESPHEAPPLMMFEPLEISPDSSDSVNSKFVGTDRYVQDSERSQQAVDVALVRQQTNPSIDNLPIGTRGKQSIPVTKRKPTDKSKDQKSLQPKVAGIHTPDSIQRKVLRRPGLIGEGRKRDQRPDTLHLVMAGGKGGADPLTINSELPGIIPSVKDDKLPFKTSHAGATFFPPPTDLETDKAIKDTNFTPATPGAFSEVGKTTTINKTHNLNALGESNYNPAIGELLRDLSARLSHHHRDQQRKQQQAQSNITNISEVNSIRGFQTDHPSPMVALGISERGGDLTSRVLNELDKLIWLSRPGTEGIFKPVFTDQVHDTTVWDMAPMMDALESPSTSEPSFEKVETMETIRATQIPNAAEVSTESPAIKIGTTSSTEIVNINTKNLTLDGEEANRTLEEGITTKLANLQKVGEWEWLRTLFYSSDTETSLDWDGLLTGLAQIMQATDVSDDLRSLSDRGSKLAENTRWMMRKSSAASEDDSIMGQGSKREDSSEENKGIQSDANNEIESSSENFTLPGDIINGVTVENGSMENTVTKDSISGNHFLDSSGDRDSHDAIEDIEKDDEDNDTNDDDDDGEEEYDNNEDDDSLTATNTNYRRKLPNGLEDDIAYYRTASGGKFTNAENTDHLLAELILQDFPNFHMEDPTSYKDNHIEREHFYELFQNNLENILGESLKVARDDTSHVQSPEIWRRKRRSAWLPYVDNRKLANRKTYLERPILKRQKRQTFFGGPELNPILSRHDPNQLLDIPPPSKSFHSQHAINVVRQQDHLLPKTPVYGKTRNNDFFNTLMSSILDPAMKNTGVSSSQSNVAGGKASPISEPDAQVSNTLSTDTLNLQTNPYSGIHQQHGHQASEITRISNTILAPTGSEANQPLNQIFETGLPFSNTNYKPISNALADYSASQQQTKLPYGEQNSVHLSKPKTHVSQQTYNNFPQQYSNTFQNPQISQTPDHNFNKDSYHHNMNSFSHNNYNNKGSPPYQGFNLNQNSYMQTPYRNSPSQQWQNHYPIGGYGHYLNHLGIHFPDVGFIGGPSVLSNPAEPGEMPSFDPEEILANIFKQYWQRVNRMYNPPGPPTTTTMEPGEYEGEITTKQPTIKTTTARTTTTTTLKPTTTPPPSPQPTTKTSTTAETSPVIFDMAKMLLPGTTASPLAKATSTSSGSLTSGLPEVKMTTNSATLTTQQDYMFSASVPAITTTGTPTDIQSGRIPAVPVRK